MKTILCLLLLCSLAACQKEIQFYTDSKTGQTPSQAPEPEPQPEPEPDSTASDTVSAEIGLSSLDNLFTSDRHYRLAEHYSATKDLWEEVPEWVKDDVYTFRETGEGIINHNERRAPNDTSSIKKKRWLAYADNIGLRLEWFDTEYKPVVYLIEAIVEGESFIVSIGNGNNKIFSEYRRKR